MTGIEELFAAGMAAITDAGVGSTILSAAATGAAGAAVGSILAPKIPGAKAPSPMPDPQAQDAARRRAIAEQIGRRGRQSTILTDPAETLG